MYGILTHIMIIFTLTIPTLKIAQWIRQAFVTHAKNLNVKRDHLDYAPKLDNLEHIC